MRTLYLTAILLALVPGAAFAQAGLEDPLKPFRPHLAGSGSQPRALSADEVAEVAREAQAALQTHCARCHSGGASKGGFGYVLDRDRLVSRGLVRPGQSAHSDLWLRIEKGEMPPSGPLPKSEIGMVRAWIELGAPAFTRTTSHALAPWDVTAAVLADLESLDERQRRFTRYLSLGHLPQQQAITRAAATKLLNSLSWHPRITQPEPIGDTGLVLRLDLRASKWTPAMWDRLVSSYPYRAESNTERKALAAFTGTEVPIIRADWFVAHASQPPLYYELLQLPNSDRALERLLGVQGADNLQTDRAPRAAFNDSGVSKNNRLIERHDAAYGAYWRSYDFGSNEGRQNLFEHPTGPNAGATSFQPAGGEMIFHLPNGLQAYFLVDAKGQRIEKGPIEIVADPRRPDKHVVAGLSCMSCHATGLIYKADRLRDHVEASAKVFGKQVVDTVRAAHPRAGRMQALIDEDNAWMMRALKPLGVHKPEDEPVNVVTERFEGTLDGPSAAAELGLSVEQLGQFLKKSSTHARLLGALTTAGGTVSRGNFEKVFGEVALAVTTAREAGAMPAGPALPPFAGHRASIETITFAPDGTMAASASADKNVRVWRIPSGELLASFATNSEIQALAFTPDGKRLAAGGRNGDILARDLATQQVVTKAGVETGGIRCLAYAPDGKRLASGDHRRLIVWGGGPGEFMDLHGHTGAITCVQWTPDGKHLVSGGTDGVLRWWDAATGKPISQLEGHSGPILSLHLADGGKTVLTGGNDRTARIWDVHAEQPGRKFLDTAAIQVRLTARGAIAVSSYLRPRSDAVFALRWPLTGPGDVTTLKAQPGEVIACAAIAPAGDVILVGGPDGRLRLLSFDGQARGVK